MRGRYLYPPFYKRIIPCSLLPISKLNNNNREDKIALFSEKQLWTLRKDALVYLVMFTLLFGERTLNAGIQVF